MKSSMINVRRVGIKREGKYVSLSFKGDTITYTVLDKDTIVLTWKLHLLEETTFWQRLKFAFGFGDVYLKDVV